VAAQAYRDVAGRGDDWRALAACHSEGLVAAMAAIYLVVAYSQPKKREAIRQWRLDGMAVTLLLSWDFSASGEIR
jgi:hypothetical protein